MLRPASLKRKKNTSVKRKLYYDYSSSSSESNSDIEEVDEVHGETSLQNCEELH